MKQRLYRSLILVFLFLLSASLFMGVCTQPVRAAFSVTIWAWDPDGWVTGMPIYRNGVFSGQYTPYTFNDANSSETFMLVGTPPGGYSFDSWNTGETNIMLVVSSSGTYTAQYGSYHVYIQAWDPLGSWSQVGGVPITEDGVNAGLVTPCTITGLVGTHTFTVPSSDTLGYPFSRWENGWPTTTITVNSMGTYRAV